MRVDVDMAAGAGEQEPALQRLRFVLARFGTALTSARLHSRSTGRGRIGLRAVITLANGEALTLRAEDEASEAAVLHFIDRVGRLVARRCAQGGPREG
jgi:hypothetical protein